MTSFLARMSDPNLKRRLRDSRLPDRLPEMSV